MSRLNLYAEGAWIAFRSNNASFIKCIKTGIAPTSYRRYDPDNRQWLVYHTKADQLVGLASKFFIVDWGDLPGAWQMLIAGGRSRTASVGQHKEKISPYATLYLLDTAPKEVVKAAYKSLLSMYHPDHNKGIGNEEKLNETITAYRLIIGDESS